MARSAVKWTQAKQEEFIAAVIANGGNVEGTAKELGIPRSTAWRLWRNNPVGAEAVTIKRREFSARAYDVIFKVMRELSRRLRNLEPDRLNAYTKLIAMLYDKQSHANLEPTKRVESRSLNVSVERSQKAASLVAGFVQRAESDGASIDIEALADIVESDKGAKKAEEPASTRTKRRGKRPSVEEEK